MAPWAAHTPATSDLRQATRDKRPAPCDLRSATRDKRPATSDLQQAFACFTSGATRNCARMVAMAIEAEKLARRYGRRWALAGVTFSIPKGAVMMIAGPNGSGKSTLLRVLSTAIRPDGGRASVGGFDVVQQRDDIRQVSALLSHYSYLYESLSARENLEILARLTARDGIDEILEKVGLAS